MLLFKRLFLGSFALAFIFFGGSGTQSTSVIGQAVGIISIIVGLVVLYIFLKIAWRSMGCLPSFLIFSAVVLFLLYALGVFDNGIANFGQNISKLIGGKNENSSSQSILIGDVSQNPQDSKPKIKFSEAISQPFSKTEDVYDEDDIFQDEIVNVFEDEQEEKIQESSNLLNSGENRAPANPMDSLPSVYGHVKVVNADTLLIQGRYLKIFGVDGPEANQTCANKQGRSYQCGKEAALWLRGWVSNYEVECRIMKKDGRGNMVGTCMLGDYDIGAALINAGWVVVTPEAKSIYGPYEEQAQINRRGLWQGKFYRPADWRQIQSRKPKIKVINNNKKKSTGMFGF